MEQERYEALVRAIELGSLSAAAEKMGITPSGMSRMMAALEDETGFPLLYRRHEGVIPTPECAALLPAIREWLFHGEKCRQLAAQIRGLETGTVTIGTAYSEWYGMLSGVIAEFRRKFPGIVVQLDAGYSSELVRKLEDRRMDICLISRREGSFEWIPLGEDEMVAWVPAEHELAKGVEVPVAAFTHEPYIDLFPGEDSDNARVFEKCRVRPNVQFSTTDSHSAYAMVDAGLGISMNNTLNSGGRHGRVRILPLSPRQSVETGIAVCRQPSPAVQRFVDCLREAIAQSWRDRQTSCQF